MNLWWPQLVVPWTFSSFPQRHGSGSREGGLWHDPKLGFCQVGGAGSRTGYKAGH